MIISQLKLNKLVLNKVFVSKISEYIEDKTVLENALGIYQLAKIFGLQSLHNIIFNHLKRCFTMLTETDNFLELDYLAVSKILGSSELHITSELEVFNAANEWLGYNIEERRELAKQLLQIVRLPFLSDHALQYLLKQTSFFTANYECVAIIKETLDKKAISINKKASVILTNRFCNQTNFNILVCGGCLRNYNQELKNVCQIDGNNLETVNNFQPMIKERQLAEAVCLKGDVYVFGGLDHRFRPIMSVEKYSYSTNTWNIVAGMFDERKRFCACAFMKKIFIIGGCYLEDGTHNVTNSCLQFNTKHNTWKEVSGMNEVRSTAACAVFEGNVIVAGGWNYYVNIMSSVESYDVIADKWSAMPNMIKYRNGHSLVVVKNKLFVIGSIEDGCELFDSTCKKFVDLKLPLIDSFFLTYTDFSEVIAIGSKIIVFGSNKNSVLCYDVEKDEWSQEPCDVTKSMSGFSCVKVPWF